MIQFQMISGEPSQVLEFYDNSVSCKFEYRIEIEGEDGTNQTHSHQTVNDDNPPKLPFTGNEGEKNCCHQQDFFLDLNNCVVTGENGFQVIFFPSSNLQPFQQ